MKQQLTRLAPLGLALIVIVGTAARQQAAPDIGLVNLGVLMEQTPGYQEAREQYVTEMEGYETEMTQLRATFDSMVSAYEQQQVVLSPSARTDKQQEIQQLQLRMQNRGTELEELAGTRQRALLSPLEDRVQTVIDGIRAERSLAVIFDVSQPSNIVSADPSLDITAMVASRLTGS